MALPRPHSRPARPRHRRHHQAQATREAGLPVPPLPRLAPHLTETPPLTLPDRPTSRHVSHDSATATDSPRVREMVLRVSRKSAQNTGIVRPAAFRSPRVQPVAFTAWRYADRAQTRSPQLAAKCSESAASRPVNRWAVHRGRESTCRTRTRACRSRNGHRGAASSGGPLLSPCSACSRKSLSRSHSSQCGDPPRGPAATDGPLHTQRARSTRERPGPRTAETPLG